MCWRYFFFFKQKTAYEMAQCDWSSDVCSSDLGRPRRAAEPRAARRRSDTRADRDRRSASAARSEERRVGQECIEPCRARWWPHLSKRTVNNDGETMGAGIQTHGPGSAGLAKCYLVNVLESGRSIVRLSVYFFFFKQKTAYEMAQCDWSSDVCSSD